MDGWWSSLNWPLVYLASEWLIRLVMLVYVPQRRNPAAARTWLLLIFIQPYVGILLYALFGRAYLPPRRVELQSRVSHLIRTVGQELFGRHVAVPELPPQFQQAVTLAQNLGDFGIVGGNRLELLPEYAGSIDRLVQDIDAARHHVHLLYYIFADDATARRVEDALVRAARRGVICRLLIDSVGSKASRKVLAQRLGTAGVEVRELLPVGLFRRRGARYDLRNHRKIVVIDGRVGYVGSQNIVNPDFKQGITYEELVARVTGPVVQQLQAVFLGDRFFETETPLADRTAYFPTPVLVGAAPAQTLPSGPGYPQANNHRLIVALLHAAQKRVVITTPYFIPDDTFQQAMQTAVLRGVEVHLIVSSQADQVLVGLAQKSYYEDLLAAGVQIHLYRQRFLHAKHLSVDDAVALIGSSNMDMRSFTLNAEISLLVYDSQVAADLRVIQERYLAGSDLLSAEAWRRRPMLTRTLQNMARLVDSVL